MCLSIPLQAGIRNLDDILVSNKDPKQAVTATNIGRTIGLLYMPIFHSNNRRTH